MPVGATPTFDGNPMFGLCMEMHAGLLNPVASQQNSYPGLNGVEELTQGLRGRFTLVKGRLGGNFPVGLGAAEAFFKSYHNGRYYYLYDQTGQLWPYVKLESFQTSGRIQTFPTGYCTRMYEARFRHAF